MSAMTIVIFNSTDIYATNEPAKAGDIHPIWLKRLQDGTEYSIVTAGQYIYIVGDFYPNAAILKYDKDGNSIWTRSWGKLGTTAKSVAVDGSNIYVVGDTEVTHMNGGVPKTSNDVFILKYDLNGNLLWNRTWGYDLDDFALSVAIDRAYIYIAGCTNSTWGQSDEALVLKYDVNGNYIWSKTTGKKSGCSASGIAIDSTYIYITAYRRMATGSFIQKYDMNGKLVWNKSYSTKGAYCLAIDNANIYIAGNGFVQKCDKNGDLKWDIHLYDENNYEVTSLAIDSNSIYLVGGTYSGESGQLFVFKYDKSGNFDWVKTWNDGEEAIGRAVAVDSACIYVVGVVIYRVNNYPYDHAIILKTDLDGNGGINSTLMICGIISILAVISIVIGVLINKRMKKKRTKSDQQKPYDESSNVYSIGMRRVKMKGFYLVIIGLFLGLIQALLTIPSGGGLLYLVVFGSIFGIIGFTVAILSDRPSTRIKIGMKISVVLLILCFVISLWQIITAGNLQNDLNAMNSDPMSYSDENIQNAINGLYMLIMMLVIATALLSISIVIPLILDEDNNRLLMSVPLILAILAIVVSLVLTNNSLSDAIVKLKNGTFSTNSTLLGSQVGGAFNFLALLSAIILSCIGSVDVEQKVISPRQISVETDGHSSRISNDPQHDLQQHEEPSIK
jgi:NADH:ubiquinone oxidoreductase subunit 3 (subunit A)